MLRLVGERRSCTIVHIEWKDTEGGSTSCTGTGCILPKPEREREGGLHSGENEMPVFNTNLILFVKFFQLSSTYFFVFINRRSLSQLYLTIVKLVRAYPLIARKDHVY